MDEDRFEQQMAMWAGIVHGEDLEPYIERFERDAYQPVLRPIIEASTKKGMSGDVGAVTLRSFVMAGRIMLTFECDGKSVTILGADGEDAPRFGLHALEATVFEAREMLEIAADLYRQWPQDYGSRFKDDPHTTLDVLAGR